MGGGVGSFFGVLDRFVVAGGALRGVGGVWKVVLESFVGRGSVLKGCWVRLVGGVGNGSLSSH